MILIVNLGLKSIRAILFDKQGKRMATSGLQVNSRLGQDRVEQSIPEWRDKLFSVVSDVLDTAGADDAVDYISVSCSSSCLVPVTKDLGPAGQVIMVSDKRAKAEGIVISQNPEFQRLAQLYGYSASQYSQLARILWLKHHQPETHARTWKYLSPNDYIISVMTGGTAVTDTLNAEKLFWDKQRESYPVELFESLDLDVGQLPECVEIGTNVGSVSSEFAEAVGLPNRPQVVVGTYDAICSVFGTGVSSPGQVCDVSGTVTSIRMYSDTPFVDQKGRIFSQHFPPTHGYLLGGSNNLGGGLIEWAKTCFYKGDDNPYESIQAEISEVIEEGITHAGLVFLPNLLGSRAPDWNPNSRGVFFGLERHHDRAEMIRAIVEAIGFSIRDFLEIFKESQTTPDMITASGGLAKLTVANEIKATITGLPYHYMDEFESTALGAAIIVMCATGYYDSYSEACKDIVATRQIFLPRRHLQAYYEDMYGLYRELSAAMDPLFEKRRIVAEAHASLNVERVENL